MVCTQGSGTSLSDTLAHSYTPIVHMYPLLASIKGRSRALMREGRAGGRADEQAHSLSPSRTLVTPTASVSPWHRITRAVFSPLVFHLAPTHLDWDTQRQFYSSVQGPPGVETPTNDIYTGGQLKKPPVLMIFTLAVGKQPPVKKTDFYWPLALAALENASANSSRTATIELMCTSVYEKKSHHL
jgi:hypothetical protein